MMESDMAARVGLSYANMHTTNFGGGEIRGQVRRGLGHGRGVSDPWNVPANNLTSDVWSPNWLPR